MRAGCFVCLHCGFPLMQAVDRCVNLSADVCDWRQSVRCEHHQHTCRPWHWPLITHYDVLIYTELCYTEKATPARHHPE